MTRFHRGLSRHDRGTWRMVRSPMKGVPTWSTPVGKAYSDCHSDVVMDLLEGKTDSMSDACTMHRVKYDSYYKVIAAAFDMGYDLLLEGDTVRLEKL